MSGNHHNFPIYSLTDGLTSLAQDTEAKPPCAIMLPISTFDALAHWPFIPLWAQGNMGISGRRKGRTPLQSLHPSPMSIPLKDASSRENFGKPSSCASKSQEWIQWSIMAGSGRSNHWQEDQQHFSNNYRNDNRVLGGIHLRFCQALRKPLNFLQKPW